jgi:hypothetical protein
MRLQKNPEGRVIAAFGAGTSSVRLARRPMHAALRQDAVKCRFSHRPSLLWQIVAFNVPAKYTDFHFTPSRASERFPRPDHAYRLNYTTCVELCKQILCVNSLGGCCLRGSGRRAWPQPYITLAVGCGGRSRALLRAVPRTLTVPGPR